MGFGGSSKRTCSVRGRYEDEGVMAAVERVRSQEEKMRLRFLGRAGSDCPGGWEEDDEGIK